MSKPANPMELVDRYLQAVRFWLPKSQREQGLITEFGEDLRSQIDEKEAELGRPLDEREVAEILKRCGSPVTVAAGFRQQQYLIGPALFPVYLFVLKMVLLWILIPVFIFIVGPTYLASSGDVGTAVARTIGELWSGLFIAAGIITLVFAIIERTAVLTNAKGRTTVDCKWDPLKLPPLQKQPRKKSGFQTACELAFNVFGLMWLLLLPGHLFLIFGPAAAFLAAGTVWQTFYWPIVMLSVLTLIRSAITLARPQWGWFPPAAELLQTVISMIILNALLNAAIATPNGTWHPFVVVAQSARGSLQYAKVAAIVNVSILIGLAWTWIAFGIAAAVQTWRLLKYLRKQVSGASEPLSVRVP